MTGRRLGIAYIKVNANLLESMPGASINVGGQERTPYMSGDRLLGFSYKGLPSEIQCEIAVGPQTSIAEINRTENATIVFQCDTGQNYTVSRAALAEPPTITAADGGKVGLRFIGAPAVEMMNN